MKIFMMIKTINYIATTLKKLPTQTLEKFIEKVSKNSQLEWNNLS